ncbi:histidine kinase [Oleiagrimonas sp. C23AA]|uniref:sensor histidine kinase n=1 Tax=Oleiagrimonas sp. C23AA TaxID=2719047 RepID=UPI00141FFFD3|nr:histidine kinase [Oleiagrimonas sp. C23AA]NII11328.1 histidine kinase [Oleiagrimonas sp. C23AA]
MMRVAKREDAALLPDFCRLPVLFALLLVAGITVTVMLLAPGTRLDFSGYSTAVLFAVWLALINAVLLCKSRPWLLRLPGLWPYLVCWLGMVLVVAVASALVWWLDRALMMDLAPVAWAHFVLGNMAIAALIGAALLRYFYVLEQWRARLAAAAQAQVQALQARIRPHFLFNSMNTVAALVRVDAAAAERTIEDLADLFRAALSSDDMGTVGDELVLIERYLGIEQWRLGERLHVERDLERLPRQHLLPRLLLQPLVENAVHHGVQPRLAGGCVRMRGGDDDGMLWFAIDNPLPDGPTEPGLGHGLESVRQRMRHYYGGRGHMQAGREHGRFCVTLRWPRDITPLSLDGSAA